MREKARDLIYLDTKRYISLNSLRAFYKAIIIFPLIVAGWGVVAINMSGITWKSLFPLISIAIWNLLYWIFVLTIQSRKTKKTFELRFLVNGISGLFISSLFWILYSSLNLVANKPIVGFDFLLWILFFYLLFSTLYIGFVIFGVHKGVFKKIKEKSQTPKALAISSLFASILPCTGVLGIYTSKMLRQYASISTQNFVGTLACVLIIFIPILAHVNFIQYFYCKKYKILCDEHGDTTSPNLELFIKNKTRQSNLQREMSVQTDMADSKSSKKRIPLIIKILIGVLSIPIVLFTIVFLVFLIKGLIERAV